MNYVILFLLVHFILFIILIEWKYCERFLFGSLFLFFNFLFSSLMKYSFVLLCKYEKLN